MIAALMLSLLWWSCWWMFRDVPTAEGTAPPAAAARRPTDTTTARGLEDDPDQWLATRGAWTTLDECQLIRLLTDSAPVNRARTNSTDNTGPRIGNGDMP